ncbi:MFS transporter [Actinotignum sanguinis]|uniref:MFS transporter n=1 Tax=Actinotignum TaxID=1653174 RepID=UPI000F7E1D66|nr:MFS transporter [Actinotignum sanguinis]MDY5148110.1 MFS transporter [Actinotignum sanguinis]RTE50508.1 MFS transporter [Actinotignum sanguinis]
MTEQSYVSRRRRPPSSRHYSATQLRHARLAVSALFFTNGAIFANIVPRFPELKRIHELDNAVYGLALAAFPAGGIIAGIFAAPLIRKFGSAPVAVAGTLLTALGLIVAGVGPTGIFFAAGMFLGGACDAATDVGQNAHGLRVQRHYGRSIINTFHATWSVGAMSGGLMSAGAIWIGLPVPVHMVMSGIVWAAVALVARCFCLPGNDAADPGPGGDAAGHAGAGAGALGDGSASSNLSEAKHGAAPLSFRTAAMLAALVLIATMGGLIEDAGSSWATLYVGQLGAVGGLAAAGYVGLVGSQFVGRLLGDGLVDRFGRRTVAQGGAVLITVGMGLALLFPSVLGTIAGFAVAGFGSATLVPAAIQQADELPGLKPGTGLTVISWLMRIGFLVSPPIVGMVADSFGLRTGLCVVPFAGITVLLLSWTLSQGEREIPASPRLSVR